MAFRHTVGQKDDSSQLKIVTSLLSVHVGGGKNK